MLACHGPVQGSRSKDAPDVDVHQNEVPPLGQGTYVRGGAPGGEPVIAVLGVLEGVHERRAASRFPSSASNHKWAPGASRQSPRAEGEQAGRATFDRSDADGRRVGPAQPGASPNLPARPAAQTVVPSLARATTSSPPRTCVAVPTIATPSGVATIIRAIVAGPRDHRTVSVVTHLARATVAAARRRDLHEGVRPPTGAPTPEMCEPNRRITRSYRSVLPIGARRATTCVAGWSAWTSPAGSSAR